MKDLFLRPLFTWRSAVASKHGPANPTMKHVLIFLSLHMSEKGDSCFPSTRLLAEETGLNQRTIVKQLAEAGRLGWIGKREQRLQNGQGWRRIEYFPQIPPGVEKMFHEKQREDPEHSRQGEGPGSSAQRDARSDKGEGPGSKGECPDDIPLTRSTSRVLHEGRASRGTRLPDDFKISDPIREWCHQEQFNPEQFIDAFKDHWKAASGKNAIKLDWDATFRNWMRNERKFGNAPFLAVAKAVFCVYTDKAGSDICGMSPANPSPLYGGRPICAHHQQKLTPARLTHEQVGAHVANIKKALRPHVG